MKKVMVVDDSRLVIDEVTRLLSGTSFEMAAGCRDAEAAILSYAQCRPDVVLMDIVLPGLDGMQATGALLAKWPEAKVLIASSLALDDTIAHARRIGAKGFLVKPFTREQLLNALQAAAL